MSEAQVWKAVAWLAWTLIRWPATDTRRRSLLARQSSDGITGRERAELSRLELVADVRCAILDLAQPGRTA